MKSPSVGPGERAGDDDPWPTPQSTPTHQSLETLELLLRRREPYLPLLADIVRDSLDEFPPRPDAPLIEIGAGTGALRAALPSDARHHRRARGDQRTAYSAVTSAAVRARL